MCIRVYYLGLCKYTLWRSHNDKIAYRRISQNIFLSLSDAYLYLHDEKLYIPPTQCSVAFLTALPINGSFFISNINWILFIAQTLLPVRYELSSYMAIRVLVPSETVPWLSRLVAGLSTRIHGFDSRPVFVKFVVD